MTVQDFVRALAPRPDWIKEAWAGSKRRGIDSLPVPEVDAD
jgi:hypothetical protein